MIWLEYFLLRNYNFHEYMYQELYNNPFMNSHSLLKNNDDIILKKKIIITGLARNIENKIKKNIDNCVLIGSFFSEYKIIIFENDSNDDTRNIIKNIQSENKNVILIECENDCRFNERNLYDYGIMNNNRINRMAFYRNIYLYYIYKYYPEYDYVFVIDFDIDGIIPISGIHHALRFDQDWSCICANGRSSIPGTFGCMDTMYDAMAYCNTFSDIEDSKTSKSFMRLFYKYLNLLYISQKSDNNRYISVYSAFNGFCIYRLSDIYNIYYKYGYNCEHISLHEQLIKNGKKIWIDMNLCIYVGHQGPKKISQFIS